MHIYICVYMYISYILAYIILYEHIHTLYIYNMNIYICNICIYP